MAPGRPARHTNGSLTRTGAQPHGGPDLTNSLPPRELLEQITTYSTDSIFLVDRDYRILFISKTSPDLTVEQVIGTRVLDYLSEDQHPVVQACLERVAQTRQPDVYMTTYVGEQGAISRWESRVGPTLVGDEVTGFVLIARDVTARHEAAAERDRLFELSLDLLCVASPDGYFRRCNPAFSEALGYTEAELLSQPFTEFVTEEDRERTQVVFKRLVEQGGEVTSFENRYLHKDGGTRTLEWNAQADPITKQVFAIARDVTEARALQEQLRQAQKLEAVGQLAGGIAHDFNNLLQAILGNVHFARAEGPSAALEGRLSKIEAAAGRAAELTKKLLAFGRQQPVKVVPIDLNQLLRDLVALLQRVIPEHIQLDLIAGHRLDPIAGDRSQIEQVVMNLCLNAGDMLPQGGQITIETENVLVDDSFRVKHPWAKVGRYVLLSVSDNGPGIPDEIRGRIFDPFFSTKNPEKGTGLGLSIVYGIVQQHEGAVHASNEPGGGAVFKVYLPVSVQLEGGVGAKPGSQADGNAELILIAEDEPLVRELVVDILESGGYHVLTATNGREAVKLCQAHDNVDLALLDVVMPELNGPEAARQLASLRPNLPILFCSGYHDHARFSELLSEVPTVIKKPYHPDALLSEVRAALDSKAGNPPAVNSGD